VTVKIYGPTASRAARALWIVHELGIPFEHVAMEMKDLKGADYLKINPNGKVPTLIDGDFKLFESMAINLYLAAKYNKNDFLPASLEEQAVCHQWSFWGMTEVEKPLLTILIDHFMTAPDKRKPEAVAEAQKVLPKPFGVLNGALQGRDYLLGSTFTAGPSRSSTISRPSPMSARGSTAACRGRPTRRPEAPNRRHEIEQAIPPAPPRSQAARPQHDRPTAAAATPV